MQGVTRQPKQNIQLGLCGVIYSKRFYKTMWQIIHLELSKKLIYDSSSKKELKDIKNK